MAKYAARTRVPIDRSLAEIKRSLKRYGAEDFVHAERRSGDIVGFVVNGLQIRIDLTNGEDDTDQDRRSRWRALCLVIKAKLEAIDSEISTIEQEFMPFVVGPDGRTLWEIAQPKLLAYSQSGEIPRLLPAPPGNPTRVAAAQ